MKIEQNNVFPLLMSAMRYSLGRRTYMPSLITQLIIDNQDLLTEWQREQMAREILEYEKQFSLGDACDVAVWHNFLKNICNNNEVKLD